MYRGGVKKCQTLTFKVNFLYQISSEYFWFFSHFLITSIFKSLYFLNDVQFLTAHHYSNSQNSIISFDCSWFLAKNLSNFLSFPWKLHNRYCHNLRSRLEKCLDPASQRCPACALTYDKKQSRLRHFIWSHQDLEGLVVQDAQVRLSEFMPSLRYFKTRQISAL